MSKQTELSELLKRRRADAPDEWAMDEFSKKAQDLESLNNVLRDAMEAVRGLVRNSSGVMGYHLNGAEAEWNDFPEIEQMEAAISKAREV